MFNSLTRLELEIDEDDKEISSNLYSLALKFDKEDKAINAEDWKEYTRKVKEAKREKGWTTGYILWYKEIRPMLKKKHPDWTFREIDTYTKRMWGTMTLDERKPYEEDARRRRNEAMRRCLDIPAPPTEPQTDPFYWFCHDRVSRGAEIDLYWGPDMEGFKIRWDALSDPERAIYKEMAEFDAKRFEKEDGVWQLKKVTAPKLNG